MSIPSPSPSRIRTRTRLSAAAGVLGAAAALSAVTGIGPAPSLFQLTGAVEDVRGNCDEAEHAGDPSCVGTASVRGADDDTSSTSTTASDGVPTTSPVGDPATGDVRTFQAGEAGSVLVEIDGVELRLLVASPNQGWSVDVEEATGHEVEVTFVSGTRRVDLNLELEDGQVRERLRSRDDATDGVVADDHSGDDDDSDDVSGDDDDSGDDDSDDDDSGDDDSGDDDSDDDSGDDSGDDDSDDDSDLTDDAGGQDADDGPDHD